MPCRNAAGSTGRPKELLYIGDETQKGAQELAEHEVRLAAGLRLQNMKRNRTVMEVAWKLSKTDEERDMCTLTCEKNVHIYT